MSKFDIEHLRASIKTAGATWRVRELPAGERPRGLGWNPSPPETIRLARTHAQLLMAARPHLFRNVMVTEHTHAAAPVSPGPTHPRSFDWRSRDVIGPVTDQLWCGSCVSHAATGLVGAMMAIERGGSSVHLSEADLHFNSSHGATCGGWNNSAALDSIKTRGVVTDADLTYRAAFDSPPVGDPNDQPAHLWIAHARTISDRDQKIFRITAINAWTGDDRKTYLANVGPLICGFTVYEDFDNYGGGVYKHVTGGVRGGHAVLVVGYSDDEQCWICRNSWGAGFGGAAGVDGTGAGYFKIGYGECNIDNEAFFGAQGVIPSARRIDIAICGAMVVRPPPSKVNPPPITVHPPAFDVTPPEFSIRPPAFEVGPPAISVAGHKVSPPRVTVHPPAISVRPPPMRIDPPEGTIDLPSLEVQPPPFEVRVPAGTDIVVVDPPPIYIDPPRVHLTFPALTVNPPAVIVQPPALEAPGGTFPIPFPPFKAHFSGFRVQPPGLTIDPPPLTVPLPPIDVDPPAFTFDPPAFPVNIKDFTWGSPRATTLVRNGRAESRMNVVLIGDGYTAEQQAMFRADADRVVQAFRDTEPMKSYFRHFNFHRVDVISPEDGATDTYASPPLLRRTALHTFFSPIHEQRLVGPDTWVKEVVSRAGVSGDQVLVIVNAPRRGGATAATMDVAYASRNSPDFPSIMIHQAAHAIANVMDEYDYELPDIHLPSGWTLPSVLPWANVDSDPRHPKWQAWLTPGVALPTPLGGPVEVVGAFQGAAYAQSGVYRPQAKCMMRDHKDDFCVVCAEAWIQAIYRRSRIADGFSPGPYGAQVVRPDAIRTSWFLKAPGEPQWRLKQQTDDYQPLKLTAAEVGTRQVKIVLEDPSARIRTPAVRDLARQEHVWSAAWQQFELCPADTRAPGSGLASLSRRPDTMELWWVAGDGSVQAACWYDGSTWQHYTLAPAGSASPTGGIAAVSRNHGDMDVWWIAPDGAVQAAAWREGGSWQRYELAPAGSAAVDSRLAAVARIAASMEVWWVSPEGALMDANWYEDNGWSRFELAPRGSAVTCSSLAAVSRAPHTMEVWWVAPDGALRDANWYEHQGWRTFELAPKGSASTRGGMAAVARIPGSMEVWWVAPDGGIQDAHWYQGGGWNRFELAPRGSSVANSGVTAMSRLQTSMDVAWVGPGGTVELASWYEGAGWTRHALRPAESAALYTGMTGVSRIPRSREMWWFSPAGGLQDMFWYE